MAEKWIDYRVWKASEEHRLKREEELAPGLDTLVEILKQFKDIRMTKEETEKEATLDLKEGNWIVLQWKDSEGGITGRVFFTQEGYEQYLKDMESRKEIYNEAERKAWYRETIHQELENKLKEQQEIVLKEMEYEQKIKDTLSEFMKQQRTKEEQEYKEKFQQLGNILKITDITENWDWKTHFANMFSGYSDLFEEYVQYPTSGILVHRMEQDWRDKPTEIWEGKTLMDAYKFVEEQIEELKEAGVELVYKLCDVKSRRYNSKELYREKWFEVCFTPKNESQKRWIYEAVEYLKKFGITFDTYANPTERVWQIDWSFKFNKNECNFV